MEKMNKGDIMQAIIDYFKNNEEAFTSCIEELDWYNGYLGDNRYYNMEDLAEIYSGVDPIEILNRAYFGHDEDSYITDNYGEKHYDAFNPNRDYFTFNGYGNLVSSDWKDYSYLLDNWAVSEMAENRRYIDSIEYDEALAGLFDALEAAEA